MLRTSVFGLLVSCLWATNAVAAEGTASGALKVLVPNISAPPSVLEKLQLQGPALTASVTQTVRDGLHLQALSASELVAVLDETNKAKAGCEDLSCSLELARLSKANLVLRTELGQVGSSIVVTASVINVGDGRVANTVTHSVATPDVVTQALGYVVMKAFGREVAPPASAPPAQAAGPRERVLVMPPQVTAGLLDPAAQVGLSSKAAGTVTKLGSYDVLTSDDAKNMLQSQADLQALGEGNPDVFAKVASAMNARYLVTSTVAKTGTTILVTATLVDSQAASVVNRGTVTVPRAEQLDAAMDVAIKRVFGVAAELPPPPPSSPNQFEQALKALSADVKNAWTAMGGAGTLAVVPFSEGSSRARDAKIGKQAGGFLRHVLSTEYGLKVAPAEQVTNATKNKDVIKDGAVNSDALQEAGLALGAQALVVGSVEDVGTDYMLMVRLVKTVKAEEVWAGHVILPKPDSAALLPKGAVVVRTRTESMFRAIVPGGGQVFNGQAWKAPLFIIPTVVSLLLAPLPILAGIAVAAYGQYLWNDKVILFNLASFGLPAAGDNCINYQFNHPEAKDQEVAGYCTQQANQYAGMGAAIAAVTLAPMIVFGIFYALGFVDAAIFGEDYSDLAAE
ncbi:MAG: hypothetical protein AB2A00_38770 [Myxococcota bacterium]